MADAVCETFTALYDAVGGISSGAMSDDRCRQEGMIEIPFFHGLPVLLVCARPSYSYCEEVSRGSVRVVSGLDGVQDPTIAVGHCSEPYVCPSLERKGFASPLPKVRRR